MAFPPEFLDELRLRLPLSEIAGKRLRLTRAGREFKAPCPFHNEKTPSFTINDQKGFFHCFGCGAHGDVVGFVMRHDSLAFPEAVEQLAGLAGLPVPRASPEERQRFEREKSLYDLLEAATRWFEAELAARDGRAARDYLAGRGLDPADCARFRLGFAPADGNALRLHLLREGHQEERMVEAGLLKRPDADAAARGRRPYAFFRNRIIFPVTDRRGRVVAFGARLIEGEGPKYINSAESPLFHKGKLLYGLSRARQATAEGQPVVVVEGYMDVIALVRAGLSGAVAPLGTALTETQILELCKLEAGSGPRLPILCFDGDGAGRRAAFRAAERVLPLLKPDHSVRIAFMPDGEDPDSLIRRRGRAEIDRVLQAARPLIEIVWDMTAEGRDLATPEAKAGFQAALEDRVRQIADRTVQDLYRRDIRQRLYTVFRGSAVAREPPGAGSWRPGLRQKQARWYRGPPPPPSWQGRYVPPPPPRGSSAELMLVLLINHPALYALAGDALAEIPAGAGDLDKLRQAVIDALDRNSDLDAERLRVHLQECGFSETLADLLGERTYQRWPFAGPQASLEDARRGWENAWSLFHGRRVEAEVIEAARQTTQTDATRADQARFQALHREAARARDQVWGAQDDE